MAAVTTHLLPESPGRAARVLEGLLGLFTGLHRGLYDRQILRSQRVGAPVISVGNLSVGGTGKTPCVIWLAERLRERGARPAIVSRGYGRRGEGILRVSVEGASVELTGDEPLEMARALRDVPVIVGRDRPAAARHALAGGDVGVILMDDGFQHRPLHRDFDLVLLDAARPFGNGHRLPAGPLREPPSALVRADAILLTRADRAGDLPAVRKEVAALAPGAWISTAVHEPVGLEPLIGSGAAGRPAAGADVIVAAGVADPEAVRESAERLGYRVAEVLAFGDHHRFTAADYRRVEAGRAGRPVLTTAKDAVRWTALGVDCAGWWVLAAGFRPGEPDILMEKVLRIL